jgi:hypothetical protein
MGKAGQIGAMLGFRCSPQFWAASQGLWLMGCCFEKRKQQAASKARAWGYMLWACFFTVRQFFTEGVFVWQPVGYLFVEKTLKSVAFET